MRFNEFKPGVIQPGMEQVIEAGDTLEITDANGQVFAVAAKESESTMDFIKAFDEWLSMRTMGVEGILIDTAFSRVREKFYHLPLRIQRELPSFKSHGVIVR